MLHSEKLADLSQIEKSNIIRRLSVISISLDENNGKNKRKNSKAASFIGFAFISGGFTTAGL